MFLIVVIIIFYDGGWIGLYRKDYIILIRWNKILLILTFLEYFGSVRKSWEAWANIHLYIIALSMLSTWNSVFSILRHADAPFYVLWHHSLTFLHHLNCITMWSALDVSIVTLVSVLGKKLLPKHQTYIHFSSGASS